MRDAVPLFVRRAFLPPGEKCIWVYDSFRGRFEKRPPESCFPVEPSLNTGTRPPLVAEALGYRAGGLTDRVEALFPKLLRPGSVILSREEEAELLLFFLLQGGEARFLKTGIPAGVHSALSAHEAFRKAWRENFPRLASCRSADEAFRRRDIPEAVNLFLETEVFSPAGASLAFLSPAEGREILLGDRWPAFMDREDPGRTRPYLLIFPLSPERLVLLRDGNCGGPAPFLREALFKMPLQTPDGSRVYPVRPLLSKETATLNRAVGGAARNSIAARSPEILQKARYY